jgi:hypothetical protein
VGAGVRVLDVDEGPHVGVVGGCLQPAVRVGHLDAVEHLDEVVTAGGGRALWGGLRGCGHLDLGSGAVAAR